MSLQAKPQDHDARANGLRSIHPPVSLGRYQLMFAIGHGGMSDVYLAQFNSAVAVTKLIVVKQLRASLLDEPEALSMFMDEARLAARLHHPNLVQTFEVGQEGPIPYMTMEFLDGQPLHRVTRRLGSNTGEHQALSLAMRLRIVTEMLEGLHYAHELRDYDGSAMNVVHRDVSPQNLFITYDGQIKLVDFGIAKASDSVTRTEGRGLKGKLAYMSPQQANGEALDRRADVFAAGVMLWELLANRRLWQDCNEATVARRLFEHDLPDLALPDVPEPLLAICRRALAPAAEDRYPTAEAFRQALEEFMRREGLDASVRAIGKHVAAAFANERTEIHARIDQQMLGERSMVSPIALWRDPHWGEPSGHTFGSSDDQPQVADPEEITQDYGPKLEVATEPPKEPEPRREASGVIHSPAAERPASFASKPVRLRTKWVLGGVLALTVMLAPLLWSEWSGDSARAPSFVEPEPHAEPSQPELTAAACDATNKPKLRLSGEIDEDATLSCERDYLLVFDTRVAPGVTLTIEPGTTIYGDRETKGTLVVQPGARLIAEGTAERPIVFTSELPEAERKPGDWGGVIILGQAPINLRNAQGQPILGQVEGLTNGGRYGGDDPDDDSGVLRYVRIEYPGSELAPGNEINGLTLAGVGRKTVIDHVAVRSSSDDCFEFFGGTVDAKHLICDAPGDDAFDFDHGYHGRLQFIVVRDRNGELLGYGPDETPGHALEIDNDPNGTSATPRTSPKIWNATLCGTSDGRSPSFAVLARRASQAELGGAVISGFDFAFDRRDAETSFELASVVLVDQAPAELDERDDDNGFDEVAWLADPGRAPSLDTSGIAGCGGPIPASLLPAAPLVPAGTLIGPPDDGFFDPKARWLGAFAGPNDDWTDGWMDWSD